MLPAFGRQYRGGCITPQAVTHSLVLLKMGKIISRNIIINKPLLLHLVGCLYYLYQWCTVKQISDNEIYLLIKYIKSLLWRVAKCLSYTEDARCLKVKYKMDTGRSLKGFGHTGASSCEMIHYCYLSYRLRRFLLCYLNVRFSFRTAVLLSESKDTACATRVLTMVNMFPAEEEVYPVLD